MESIQEFQKSPKANLQTWQGVVTGTWISIASLALLMLLMAAFLT